MVTQRIANPFTPVRFRALPPTNYQIAILILLYKRLFDLLLNNLLKNVNYLDLQCHLDVIFNSNLMTFLGSSVGRAVDC